MSSVESPSTVNRDGPTPYVYRLPQVPLDGEKYPVAPENLNLEQVHVFVRHGERGPVGVRLNKAPANIPEHWALCKAARQFRASVLGGEYGGVQAEDFLRTRKMVEQTDGTVMEGECLLGELTDIGRQSTYNFGRSLRQIYIDKLGLLPSFLNKREDVYFRSTNMPRTIESLQQVIHGLYPTTQCHANATPTILIRNGKDENLLGNTFSCKRLEILQIGFAQAAAAAYNTTLEPLDKKISKYLSGNPIRVDGRPRASGVMDTVRAAIAHGIKVPPEFEDKSIVDVIERAVVTEWFADKTEEVRRLGFGRLLDDISKKMQIKVEKGEDDPLKLLVHSTHDTALAGLCSTLDVYDEKWPAFTAFITFELFKQNSVAPERTFLQSFLSPFRTPTPKPEHYIRMRYQNRNMYLPMCAEEGKHLPGHSEFCTLETFRERVKELTPTDWETECSPQGRVQV